MQPSLAFAHLYPVLLDSRLRGVTATLDTADTSERPASPLTERALDGIRDLILRRQIWPGHQIRQEELGRLLGMSKSPVREALKAIHAEGLVEYSPNRGYFVPELSVDRLRQIYIMRRALETEALRHLPKPPASTIRELKTLNHEINALPSGQQFDFLSLNRIFHFRIFRESGLDYVNAEINRLWNLSDSYRTLLMSDFVDQSKATIFAEHEQMIDAIKSSDYHRLIRTADIHRSSAETYMIRNLNGSPPNPGAVIPLSTAPRSDLLRQEDSR
jgi:DNA-binding GntR family transcriptional regulator